MVARQSSGFYRALAPCGSQYISLFQLPAKLRRIFEDDAGKAPRFARINIFHLVIDEDGVARIDIESLHRNVKDGRIRLHHAVITRDHDVVEGVEHGKALRRPIKLLASPVTEHVGGMPLGTQCFQHRTGAEACAHGRAWVDGAYLAA